MASKKKNVAQPKAPEVNKQPQAEIEDPFEQAVLRAQEQERQRRQHEQELFENWRNSFRPAVEEIRKRVAPGGDIPTALAETRRWLREKVYRVPQAQLAPGIFKLLEEIESYFRIPEQAKEALAMFDALRVEDCRSPNARTAIRNELGTALNVSGVKRRLEHLRGEIEFMQQEFERHKRTQKPSPVYDPVMPAAAEHQVQTNLSHE